MHLFLYFLFCIYSYRVLSKKVNKYVLLVIVTSAMYLFVQLTIARFSFGFNIGLLTKHSSEYSAIVSQTFHTITYPHRYGCANVFAWDNN